VRFHHVLFVLGAALSGCTGMMNGRDAMRGSVEDALAETQVHLSTGRELATMPAMLGEVDRHGWRMDAIMGDMRDHMGSMHGCVGLRAMSTLRDGMSEELTAHIASMHAMATVQDARAEVEHHAGTMTSMLGDMDSMLDGMHCDGW